MAVMNMKINGKEYHLACDDGQEEHLRLLVDDVDDRVRDLVLRMGGNVNETMSFLLASVTMADELIENKKEIEKLKAEVKMLSEVQPVAQHQPEYGEDEYQGEDFYDDGAVVATLEEIAQRIERIADRVEMR